MEAVEIVCDIQAHPNDHIKFHWTFNNSDGTTDNNADYGNIELRHFVSNGTRSVLSFSPMSPRDFGTVLCFANNEVGRQPDACIFEIVPAGKLCKKKGQIWLLTGFHKAIRSFYF